MLIPGYRKPGGYAIYIFYIGVMLIVAILIFYIQQNIQATQSTNSQTNDIDKAVGLVFPQIAEGGFKIIFKHKKIFNTC